LCPNLPPLLHLLFLLVILIIGKELLYGLPLEQLLALSQLRLIFILPVALRIGHVEVVAVTRLVGRHQRLVAQEVPLDVAKPRVVLHFLRAVVPQTLHRLPLKQQVDEVHGLRGPTCGHLVLANLDLSGQDVVSDLLAPSAIVGPSTEHALVGYNADGVVVDTHAMVLFAHDLGSHVPRGATRLILVVLGPYAGNAEISNF
jgi:hypothetical protein